MIPFNQFKQIMAYDLKQKYCIEIEFSVNGSGKFQCCWMGKMPNKKTKAAVYWFGLTLDGMNAYDYPTFEEFSSAKIFDGKSLFDIWNNVNILSIDGCDPSERISVYIGETND